MTDFEQATLEQLVSYKAKNSAALETQLQCPKLKAQVKQLVQKWNKQRIKLGLAPW